MAKPTLKKVDGCKGSGKLREQPVERKAPLRGGRMGAKPLVSGSNVVSQVVITPRNESQAAYLNAINQNKLVFGLGPAGTGKTFVAVLHAMKGYSERQYRNIILVRPAVEAGEKLGFLPGDLVEKMDPFLNPIYDAMNEYWQDEKIQRLIETGDIKIVPLAYMRGRTFRNSVIIVDEAQNITEDQMKMLITRFGEGSKMIINGDMSQNDLPRSAISGLVKAQKLAALGLEDIACFEFDVSDVVRDPLVKVVLENWDNL